MTTIRKCVKTKGLMVSPSYEYELVLLLSDKDTRYHFEIGDSRIGVATLCASAHEGHGRSNAGETNEQYAARHMASEHHIDGLWDRDEIEAVYGVHHVYSQKQSSDDKAHKEKADKIVNIILGNIDKNRDGKISPEELEEAGLNALPSFKELGAEGHHYDIESEVYHSTPETQTDESYNHPEDIEHFAMHEKIEADEDARERKFQGIPEDQPLNSAHDHEHADTPQSKPEAPGGESLAPEMSQAPHPHDDQQVFEADEKHFPIPQRETPPEKLPPEVKFQKAALEGRNKDEWGQGTEGYSRPRTAADKMRKNLPYKYKFRRSWGDF
ncbi:hypothetical protein Clacol_007412 [Clathrus columnatus]|uniref:EF-hand domain-containing protein n=1 Tax=Clathrus columnatus TaxID=1419009 RepID=A0AAV5AL45_9AGAM|nr:hypothetical protein Clacol_007412 [Clathrus columnatus]